MRKQIFKMATLAVALAVFSSHAAMGQQKSDEKTDWMKDFTSRITFNGYAQGGYSWQDANSKNRNDFNLKRTLLWAKARITDRWRFFLCTTSQVWCKSFTQIIDSQMTNPLP